MISYLQYTTDNMGLIRDDIPEYIHECAGVCYTVVFYNANAYKVVQLCSCIHT